MRLFHPPECLITDLAISFGDPQLAAFHPRQPLTIRRHRDRAQMLKVENVQQAWQQWINKLPPARREDEDVKEIRWMIEELRVSYFAQQLGTPYPISDKRILQAMEQISG